MRTLVGGDEPPRPHVVTSGVTTSNGAFALTVLAPPQPAGSFETTTHAGLVELTTGRASTGVAGELGY